MADTSAPQAPPTRKPRARKAPIDRVLLVYPEQAPSIAALVALRVLLRCGAMPFSRGLVDQLRPRLVMLLGLVVGDLDDEKPKLVHEAFEELARRWDAHEPPEIPRGATLFAELFELEPVERDAVLLLALRDRSAGLREVWEDSDRSDLAEVVSAVTRRSAVEVEPLLRRGSPLLKRRIVVAGEHGFRYGLARGLAELLVRDDVTASDILRRFVREAREPRTKIEEFSYLGDALPIARRYLEGALATRRGGTHVLLHGAPGVGKTELARALAADVGATLFEVADEDDDGEALASEDRIGAFALAQRILRRAPRAMLLFDEAEDAFPRSLGELLGLQGSSKEKGWLHRILEDESPLPCVWTMNAVDQLDPATLRRFDLVFEIPSPPAAVRLELAEEKLGAHVRRAWIESVARVPQLTPANVERLERVATLVTASANPEPPAVLERHLGEVLRAATSAQGKHAPPRIAAGSVHATPYDLAYVNASVPVADLLAGLRARRAATLCFSGPPGTGKTAFARHLAEELGMGVVEAQASSLLSAYVGESERNVAALFRRAEREKAFLLIDEIDTFLQDRRGAQRAWESSLVNQFLVAIESFEGLFVATTNRLERLDAAVLRRFSAKVTFAPLRAAQARSLLERVCEGAASEAALREVERLAGVTAGDFAAVSKGLDLLGRAKTAEALVEALREEIQLRASGDARRVAGFR